MIFISYNWKDWEKVKKVYENLENEFGAEKIFLDRKQNLVGDDYWLNINKGLRTCDYFILFNSFNYKNSSACSNELLIALELQDKIQILEIKLDHSVDTHPSLSRKIHLKYNDANQTSIEIINSIKRNDFSGFVKESLVQFIGTKLDKENNILSILFSATKNITQPSFLFLFNIDKNIKDKDKEIRDKVNFNLGGPCTSSSGKYKDKYYYITQKPLSGYLIKGREHKVNINNFSEKDQFSLLIENPDNPEENLFIVSSKNFE